DRDAQEPSPGCGGAGAEGAGQDDHPARGVHLPVDRHRDPRPGGHRHHEWPPYVSPEAGAYEHLEALLKEAAPPRADVEAVLTLGHAEALELEAERVRIKRRLERV